MVRRATSLVNKNLLNCMVCVRNKVPKQCKHATSDNMGKDLSAIIEFSCGLYLIEGKIK